VATPEYLARHGIPAEPQDLAEHNCLAYSEFATRALDVFRPDSSKRKMPPTLTGNLSTNSGVLLMHALLAGQGIVIGPAIMVATHVARGAEQVMFDEVGPGKAALFALFPPGRFASAGRKAFVDFMIEHLTHGRPVVGAAQGGIARRAAQAIDSDHPTVDEVGDMGTDP